MLERFARLSRGQRFVVGTALLLLAAWVCMYGKLWCFETFDAHRFTSRAMLSGTLRLRDSVTQVGHDEQVYNGAVYTNWGFGVPVLQMPMHALAGALGLYGGFFPDRAIYFMYLSAVLPVLWVAFDRLLGGRMLLSWTATWMVLNVTLFPLMSTRFVIFEETLAYMMLCELLVLSVYLLASPSGRPWAGLAMGLAAGMGLLVRPTALLYVGVWGAVIALQKNTYKTVLYAATLVPFVAFWLFSNWVKSGSVFGLGYGNSNPSWEYEMPLLRFGATCADTSLHTAEAAARLFGAFFVYIWRIPSAGWMHTCHFDFEERDGTREPYLGPAVLVLLCAMVYRLVRTRERRLAMWLPYAAFLVLFASFVRRGEGFAWRYVGDFWPLILLATVDYVRSRPPEAMRLDRRMAKILFWVGFAALARYLVPWEWSSGGPHGRGRADILVPSQVASMAREFRAAHDDRDPVMPSTVSCQAQAGGPDPFRSKNLIKSAVPMFRGDILQTFPFDNALGWRPDCSVAGFANVYLGVPPNDSDVYTLRMLTDGMKAEHARVYVNGSLYSANRHGDFYEATVHLDCHALRSPIVVATVEWSPTSDPPPGRLLSIELGT